VNIFTLLFVVLIPFSTSLMNDYPADMAAEMFFNANMLVLSSLLAFNWWYACKKGYLELEENQAHIANAAWSGMLLPGISVLAIIISFIYPGWSTLAYLLIPAILYFPKRTRRPCG
jgi:uncharacterized membrane protein